MAECKVERKVTERVFKCHPNYKVPKIVICIICENVYHEGDFNKYAKGQYVSDILVICPKHHKDNLTFKTEYDTALLNEEARKIIVQVKLHEKESLRNEMCSNLSMNVSKDKDSTVNSATELDVETIRVENDLLKQLNSELVKNNDSLRDMLESKNESNDVKSFADAVKIKTVAPSIIIKAKDSNNKDTFNNVKDRVTHNTAVQINKIKKDKDGSVSVICRNSEDVSRTKTILAEKMGNSFCVNTECLKLPKIKVVNVNTDLVNEDLADDIYNRNFLDFDGGFKVVSDYKNAIGRRVLILELASEAYWTLKSNSSYIFIAHQRYKAFGSY